jgi:hypothetical protein
VTLHEASGKGSSDACAVWRRKAVKVQVNGVMHGD